MERVFREESVCGQVFQKYSFDRRRDQLIDDCYGGNRKDRKGSSPAMG